MQQPLESPLTPREKQVLSLMAEGHTSYSAGDILGIGARTVQFHINNIHKKLDTDKTVSAVLLAVHRGYIPNPMQEGR